MITTPDGFWVERKSWFMQHPDGHIVVPCGFQPNGGVFELPFDGLHPIVTVHGATGAGKSAFLNVMLYNLMTKYSPDKFQMLLWDCKGTEFWVYSKFGHPHILNDIMCSKDNAYVLAFLEGAKEVITTTYHSYLLIIIDEYQQFLLDSECHSKFLELVELVEDTPNVFMLAASQSSLTSTELLEHSTRRIMLRGDRETSMQVLGTDAAAYLPGKYGFFMYAKDTRNSPHDISTYAVPYVPEERMWSMQVLMDKKERGKVPMCATTLFYELERTYRCGTGDYGIAFKVGTSVYSIDARRRHVGASPWALQGIVNDIHTTYPNLHIYYLSTSTLTAIMQLLDKEASEPSNSNSVIWCKFPENIGSDLFNTIVDKAKQVNFHIISTDAALQHNADTTFISA